MSATFDIDRAHMARALALAARGLYTTTPNPRVGCVIVRGEAIVGEGFHARAGEAHAEVAALADAARRGVNVRGATLYATLEPCNHHGRTPPCVDAIVAARIARVVVAMADPWPEAAGGAARLRAEGIEVDEGVRREEAYELNIGFVSRVTRARPWVRIKIAATLDGRTALPNGESQWITGEQARADGHAWRARACAILTGIGTVLADDPALTARAVDTPRQPRRVIVDRHAQTPSGARVLEGDGALVVTAGERNAAWGPQVECLALPDGQGRVDLPALMRELAARGINELHVEAGAKLNGALLDAGLVDEILLYVAPAILGDPARGLFERDAPLAALAQRAEFAFRDVRRIGEDLRIVARSKGS
ncbi:MAG TPA: bifunctional diaminohydroxyphosphoribosylaminopyrimidine deaminase/5-amino-6-(5-phosphoribosylamino)uracil reductase RibD [Casimicrobiaceae bacterium]|nr:bifunctional diaminohydroxyphosphoribosylaminopyrimidine deaminase/5-amino-6-(5-phosphoribosylamino)uracil reductase RibD [Casimicrobiaceae bacterium]